MLAKTTWPAEYDVRSNEDGHDCHSRTTGPDTHEYPHRTGERSSDAELGREATAPTIVERLGAQEGIVAPRITDGRMMVGSLLIDPAYDGAVFRIEVADVTETKTDFVAGTYDLDPATTGTTVAVKITDMLGEETLVVLDAAEAPE
jgi:hypothetical protein